MPAVNFDGIPSELKLIAQWCIWRYEDVGAAKPTKVPYNSRNIQQHMSVTRPDTWSTFDETKNCFNGGGWDGIGFILTSNDPYAFIDLDDTNGNNVALERQLKISKEFDSYSEVSPSDRGLHIIVKGAVPSGRKRSFIEVYSSERYVTFTGKVYNNKPIAEHQSMLTQLWEQMGSGGVATNVYKGDDKETQTDAQIIQQASVAVNGDKFQTLLAGNWQSIYQSQSEADIAFINIIAFYSQNRNQITRIFQNSALGARDKGKRKDYVTWMINKSFDRMLPQIDFDGFTNQVTDWQQLNLPISGIVQPTASTIPTIAIPPGLMGELAQFVYAAAPRPVPEIALAAAIGLMAGICGRAYNVSNTGLNQYVLMLAATGSGKEAMASGIDRLMNAIRLQVPTSIGFIGPSEIASGQALIKHLSKTSQCFVSILGEFGIRLESLSSPFANSAEKMLKRMLLDLFNKSGHGQIFRPSIFADADKNISATEAPSFSILGESTPERFYGALNEEMISEGLLPRFMLIEYNGPRPKANETHGTAVPSMQLVDKLASLVANVEMIMHAKRVINVQATKEADETFKKFDKYCDAQINGTNKEVLRQLWNRAHMKALKIAALIAVGVNMSDPVISQEYVVWSIDMVQSDIKALSSKFEAGEIGGNSFETKQNGQIKRVIKDWLAREWEYNLKYSQGKNMKMLYDAKIIPYSYMNKRLSVIAAFYKDRGGTTVAIKRAIQLLVDSDNLREIGKQELASKYGTSQRAFVVSNVNMLNEE